MKKQSCYLRTDIKVVSSTTVIVVIHIYSPMLLLTHSRSCFIFFRLSQIIEYKDTTSYKVVVLIKYTRWIYDRGKMSPSQGYFSFTTTYECCVITITYGVTVFLMSTWIAEYGYASMYKNVYSLTASENNRNVCELLDVPKRTVNSTMLLVHLHAAVNLLSQLWHDAGYLRWKFRLVTTTLWRIENGTSPTGYIWLVFDIGKVQFTKKAPDLFLNPHAVLTKECHWTNFISDFRKLPKSGEMLTNFYLQWQLWLLGLHLWLWYVIFLPYMEFFVHLSAAMRLLTGANSTSASRAANFMILNMLTHV
ncbi:uncharacterized protein LOC113301585 [Papaver somniferum]|nr:uncharacterized protein LOC113301585 [Papaver somniferum]